MEVTRRYAYLEPSKVDVYDRDFAHNDSYYKIKMDRMRSSGPVPQRSNHHGNRNSEPTSGVAQSQRRRISSSRDNGLEEEMRNRFWLYDKGPDDFSTRTSMPHKKKHSIDYDHTPSRKAQSSRGNYGEERRDNSRERKQYKPHVNPSRKHSAQYDYDGSRSRKYSDDRDKYENDVFESRGRKPSAQYDYDTSKGRRYSDDQYNRHGSSSNRRGSSQYEDEPRSKRYDKDRQDKSSERRGSESSRSKSYDGRYADDREPFKRTHSEDSVIDDERYNQSGQRRRSHRKSSIDRTKLHPSYKVKKDSFSERNKSKSTGDVSRSNALAPHSSQRQPDGRNQSSRRDSNTGTRRDHASGDPYSHGHSRSVSRILPVPPAKSQWDKVRREFEYYQEEMELERQEQRSRARAKHSRNPDVYHHDPRLVPDASRSNRNDDRHRRDPSPQSKESWNPVATSSVRETSPTSPKRTTILPDRHNNYPRRLSDAYSSNYGQPIRGDRDVYERNPPSNSRYDKGRGYDDRGAKDPTPHRKGAPIVEEASESASATPRYSSAPMTFKSEEDVRPRHKQRDSVDNRQTRSPNNNPIRRVDHGRNDVKDLRDTRDPKQKSERNRSSRKYVSPNRLQGQVTKHKRYSQRDRADGKSQDVISPNSGEKKSVRPGAPSEPNEYNFNYKRRGLFVIINNKTFHPDTGQQSREGTDVDAERLEERFQDLGFEVKRYDDVTRSKMSTLMYDAAAYDHSDADCFGCAILSHGLEGRVYGTDGYTTLEVLVTPFKGDKCPSLVGKPKLFFLQACRGTKMDYGVDVSDSSLSSRDEDEPDSSNTVSIRKIPIEADFLFAYSTVPGYYSWRNNQDGSWFIQALCIVLENYGVKMELLHMLTHVNRIVAYEFASCTDREFTDKMKQMPCVVSMLTRYVYFRHKKQDIR